ncbi:MAG: hypothetical protein AMJ95_06590 [Omnitrophica WOR_2 bacterium SM23_72]|nr:MAG: hypothetical protein AMJ95_06590 [Omnitrophica WOR_2 bacterium SM23_72]
MAGTNRKQEKLLPHYDHPLPFVRLYWHRVMQELVKQIDAKEDELIVDFGCGKQRLKRYLPGHNIIGYDPIKEYSDIADYRVLRPHTIVCSHVLEHMDRPQLISIIEDFMRMGLKCLITAQPTENFLSRLSNLLGRPTVITQNLRPLDHRLKMSEVHDILCEHFLLKSRCSVWTLTVISKWSPVI